MSNVNATELKAVISTWTATDIPGFIWGAGGIGKSSIVSQCAESLGFKLFDMRVSQIEAIDLKGAMYIEENRTRYALPADLPTDSDGPSLLFLDEYNAGQRGVWAATYQLIQERRIGEYCLPKSCRIIAAGNRTQDNGISYKLPEPLADRFDHVTLCPDLDQWIEAFARPQSLSEDVIAFHLATSGRLLHYVDSKRQCVPIATPRGWEQVSRLMLHPMDSDLRLKMIQGRVGDGPAAEFKTFLMLKANMVQPAFVIANPDSAPIPVEPGIVYALVEALARRASTIAAPATPTSRALRIPALEAWAAINQYAKRLPSEYQSVLINASTNVCPDLKNTREYVLWVSSHTANQ
jgi:MoxR-like ATPase